MKRSLRQAFTHRRRQLCTFALAGISILIVRPSSAAAQDAATQKTGDAWAAAPMDWPNWRGPTNDGVSKETTLPADWNATKNVVWKLPLPGMAGRCPRPGRRQHSDYQHRGYGYVHQHFCRDEKLDRHQYAQQHAAANRPGLT